MTDLEAPGKRIVRSRRCALVIELSLVDIAEDPLVRLVNKADLIDHGEFCLCLERVAKARIQTRR